MTSLFRSLFKGKNKLDPESRDRINSLERIIGIRIDDPSLFLKALRHRSMLSQEKYKSYDSYERLEFLGDAVLDLIAAEILFKKYPKKDEGFLTKIRAKLVRGDTLADFTIALGMDELLELGETKQGTEVSKSILADAFESIIAALYITRGYSQAYDFVDRVINKFVDFDELVNTVDNHKSALLEYTQANKLSLPKYELISESGPGHNKVFEIRVSVEGKALGTGKGKSKKRAEQKAAQQALLKLSS